MRVRELTGTRTIVVVVGVAAVVGSCGDGGEQLPEVPGPTSQSLEVRATEMAFDPAEIAVHAGDVEVVLHNDGSIVHDLRIGDRPFLVEAAAGETTTGHVTLGSGRYQFFCSIPGHREAGMEGIVEVR